MLNLLQVLSVEFPLKGSQIPEKLFLVIENWKKIIKPVSVVERRFIAQHTISDKSLSSLYYSSWDNAYPLISTLVTL